MNSPLDPDQQRCLEEQRREADIAFSDPLTKKAHDYREAEAFDDNFPNFGEGEGRVLLIGVCVVMGIVLLLALAL